MSKQDRQGVRSATDLEQKYGFGKTFAEIMGIATDAQKAANEANDSFKGLDSQEIFNLLTDNGRVQGLFRGEDDNLYVNADYIDADKLFAKDITMSGKFTYNTKAFIKPAQEELETIRNHMLGIAPIVTEDKKRVYDSNGDGVIDIIDLTRARMIMLGVRPISDWVGIEETDVTLTIDLKNPEKFLRVSGVNMWGRAFENYIGINGTSFKHIGTADYTIETGTSNGWTYRKWQSGLCECWKTINGLKAGVDDTAAYNRVWDLPFPITDMTITCTNYNTWDIKEIRVIPLNDSTSFALGLYTTVTEATTSNAAVNINIKGKWE